MWPKLSNMKTAYGHEVWDHWGGIRWEIFMVSIWKGVSLKHKFKTFSNSCKLIIRYLI